MEIDRNELNVAGSGAFGAVKRSNIVKTLTANDVVFWGADSFISVALALFVVAFIEDATILNVGIALMIYRVSGAVSSLPIGRWFDKNRGYLDEATGLSLACFGAGFLYALLIFSVFVWQLYIIMFFLGIFATVNLTSWRILFYNHINQTQFGQTIGVYQMLYSLGIALFLAIGGFTGEVFGYDRVLLAGGTIMMAGSVLPLLIREYFRPGRAHK